MIQKNPGTNLLEVSFANGELYKKTIFQPGINGKLKVQSLRPSDGCLSEYHQADSEFCDGLMTTFCVKKYADGSTDLKYYKPSTDWCKSILGNDTQRGVNLSSYDLCPDVSMWVGIGTYQNDDTNVELFFAVDGDASLMKVSKYYSLLYPLPESESIDESPDEWHCGDFANSVSKSNSKRDIKSDFYSKFFLGSLKINNGVNTMLKMYKSNSKSEETKNDN